MSTWEIHSSASSEDDAAAAPLTFTRSRPRRRAKALADAESPPQEDAMLARRLSGAFCAHRAATPPTLGAAAPWGTPALPRAPLQVVQVQNGNCVSPQVTIFKQQHQQQQQQQRQQQQQQQPAPALFKPWASSAGLAPASPDWSPRPASSGGGGGTGSAGRSSSTSSEVSARLKSRGSSKSGRATPDVWYSPSPAASPVASPAAPPAASRVVSPAASPAASPSAPRAMLPATSPATSPARRSPGGSDRSNDSGRRMGWSRAAADVQHTEEEQQQQQNQQHRLPWQSGSPAQVQEAPSPHSALDADATPTSMPDSARRRTVPAVAEGVDRPHLPLVAPASPAAASSAPGPPATPAMGLVLATPGPTPRATILDPYTPWLRTTTKPPRRGGYRSGLFGDPGSGGEDDCCSASGSSVGSMGLLSSPSPSPEQGEGQRTRGGGAWRLGAGGDGCGRERSSESLTRQPLQPPLPPQQQQPASCTSPPPRAMNGGDSPDSWRPTTATRQRAGRARVLLSDSESQGAASGPPSPAAPSVWLGGGAHRQEPRAASPQLQAAAASESGWTPGISGSSSAEPQRSGRAASTTARSPDSFGPGGWGSRRRSGGGGGSGSEHGGDSGSSGGG
ncbi:hypothetical protein MNEG_9763, partial [Monoraphidium neglectum]